MNNSIVLEYQLSDVEVVAQRLVQASQQASVLTFTGTLGAGKTTLVAAMLRTLGVTKPVVSPTYTYMNMYLLEDGRRAYHFDLYRLDTLESFEQAGFGDYLYQKDSICLIEWPEIVSSLLTHSVGHIEIDFLGLEKRKLLYTYKN